MEEHSDAFVFFGATGDLAHKEIFPALQVLVQQGHFDVPIIGVAKSRWSLARLKERATDSLKHHGRVDPESLVKLSPRLSYVDAEYQAACPDVPLRRAPGT